MAKQNIDMPDTRASSSVDDTLLPVDGHPSAETKRGSINMRIESGTRQLIDDAAAVLGKTRTEFMVEGARLHAINILLDQRLFALGGASYDAFANALDHPPAPGPKLTSLMGRKPAWQK